MNTRRVAVAVMIVLIVSGCVCITFACYVTAWASDLMPSLLLAAMLPAYLVMSVVGTPRRDRITAPHDSRPGAVQHRRGAGV